MNRMKKASLLQAQKIVLEKFPTEIDDKIDGNELAYNFYRFLQHYDEHLRALQEYEQQKRREENEQVHGNHHA
jgi:hypothetical protein